MAALILPRRFHQQPQHAVALDPTWAQSVFFAQCGSQIYANGRWSEFAQTSVQTLAATPRGIAIATTGESTPDAIAVTPGTTFQEWSLAYSLDLVSGSTDGAFAFAYNASGYINATVSAGVVSVASAALTDHGTFSGIDAQPKTGAAVAFFSTAVGAAQMYMDGKFHASTVHSYAGSGAPDFVVLGGRYAQANRNWRGRNILTVGFNRSLTTPEALAISENPWQIFQAQPRRIYFDLGGGGSAVGATTVPRWNSLAATPKTTAPRWNSVTAVDTTKAVRWNAVASVDTTKPVTWNSLAAVPKSENVRWHMLAAVDTAQPLRWNALTTATTTGVPRWNTLAVVPKTANPSWNALAVVPKTATPRWNALTTAAKSQAIRWDMLSSVILAGTSTTLRWNALTTVTKTGAPRWNALTTAGKSATPRWDDLTAAGKTQVARWNAIAAVQQTMAPHWNMLAVAGVSKAVRWSLMQAVAQTLAARWNLLNTVSAAQAVTLRWHSIKLINKSIICRWHVGEVGSTRYDYIDVLVLPEEQRVMVLGAPQNVIVIH